MNVGLTQARGPSLFNSLGALNCSYPLTPWSCQRLVYFCPPSEVFPELQACVCGCRGSWPSRGSSLSLTLPHLSQACCFFLQNKPQVQPPPSTFLHLHCHQPTSGHVHFLYGLPINTNIPLQYSFRVAPRIMCWHLNQINRKTTCNLDHRHPQHDIP